MATDTKVQKKLLFSIMEHLQNIVAAPETAGVSGEVDVETLQAAVDCLGTSLGLSLTDEQQKKELSIAPLKLLQVFGLGLAGKEQIAQAVAQIRNQPKAAAAEAAAPAAAAPAPTSQAADRFQNYVNLLKTKTKFFEGVEEGTEAYNQRVELAREKLRNKDAEKAEGLKAQGNQLLGEGKYEGAVDFYTQAIELNDRNAIYFANRAAAYSHLNQHEKAIADCEKAIAVDASYSKAYSRLGFAHYSLQQYQKAVDAYRKGLALAPSNESIRQALQLAEQKLQEKTRSDPLAGLGAGGGGVGGAAENPFAALLQNPAIRQLAQNFAGSMGGAGGAPPSTTAATPGAATDAQPSASTTTSTTGAPAGAGAPPAGGAGMPDIASMLNNPQMMQMAEQMMSQPGMANMLNNPALMNMAQQMMSDPSQLTNMLQTMTQAQQAAAEANAPEGGESESSGQAADPMDEAKPTEGQ